MDDQNNNMWQAQSNGSAVDLGPLAWVVDALRETLNTVRGQLLYFSQEMQEKAGISPHQTPQRCAWLGKVCMTR